MTTPPALEQITNDLDEIRSHDVIARIVELERRKAAAEAEGQPFDSDEASELCDLVDLELQCVARAPVAWRTGTRLYCWDNPMGPPWTYSSNTVDFAGVTYVLRVG